MNVRKGLSLFVGFAVSGVFVWMIFRTLPFGEFLATLKSARISWAGLAVGFFVLGYVCRIWRWRLMLVQFNPGLSWGRCSVPFMASIAANNVLPFRAGDILRGVAFGNWLGIPTARVLATLLVERLLDLLSLIIALAVALALFGAGETDVQALLGWSAGAFALIAATIAFALLFPGLFQPPLLILIRLLPGRDGGLSEKIEAQVTRVFQTLSSLAHRARMATLIFWSLLAWFFEACVFYAAARALPDIAAPIAAWIAMPVGTMSTMLPSTPGYIGTFHYFVMQATEALGNAEVAAAAFAFLVHLLLFIPATLWGGICFVYWVFTRQSGPGSIGKATTL